MIISQTPFRVSFFGGGSDFPEFFSVNGSGAVLGTAIDKYVYHSVTQFPSPLFDYAIRLSYSKLECVSHVHDIEHGPFREILKYVGIEKDIEINLTADLPSFSGLGSSSSFTVGMLNALYAYSGKFISRKDLAHLAIYMEREVLKESVGCQDQVFAAYGGLNLVEFSGTDNILVHRISLSKTRLNELDSSLLMFFTGIKRRAADLEKKKIDNLTQIQENIKRMYGLVEKAHTILTGNQPLSAFGNLLDLTWQEKRRLEPGVSNPQIDRMYELAMVSGAIGGKVVGAGGGGFMIFFVPEEKQPAFRKAMYNYHEVSFSINAPGSSIIHS